MVEKLLWSRNCVRGNYCDGEFVMENCDGELCVVIVVVVTMMWKSVIARTRGGGGHGK